MIWYLCLFLSVAILLFLIKVALDKRLGVLRSLYVMIGCAIASYILYLPLMLSTNNVPTAILGGIINMLQIISLDVDYNTNCLLIGALVSSPILENTYCILLAFLHLLLPAVSAMTAVTLIVQCIADFQIKLLRRSKKTAHIFSRYNYQSEILARDIRRHDKACKLLFLDDPEETDLTNLREELGCSIIKEKITAVKSYSKSRNAYYYFISDDQEENLNEALEILGQLKELPANVQRKTHLYVFTSDPVADMIVDSIQKGFVHISLISEEKVAVYRLLMEHPLPTLNPDQELHVLVCGFSHVGKMLVRTIAWCGQITGSRLKVTVLGKGLDAEAKTFQAEYPGLFTPRYDIQFHSYDNEQAFLDLVRAHALSADYIVVAEEDAEVTVDKAIKLRRFFYRADDRFESAPPIYAYLENEARALAVAALQTAEAKAERRMPYNIIPFGVVTKTYSYENITGSDLDILSQNVHLVYEDIFSDQPIDVEGALERYNLFEVNKNSNKANALHIRYKLRMLGLDFTDDPAAEEVDFSQYLTAEKLEAMTYVEHDRWMAFLDSEGWETSTVEQAKRYIATGISKGRHNCPLLKLHPYICAFEELTARSDALGLPDSTVYDRELISRIPDILHDKWNVTDKKYKIIPYDPSKKDR